MNTDKNVFIYAAAAAIFFIAAMIFVYGRHSAANRSFELGASHLERGDASAAAELFDKAREQGFSATSSADVEMIARAYRALGHLKDESDLYESVFETISDDRSFLKMMARSYRAQGRSDDAFAAYERAFEIASDDADISLELGKLCEARLDDARAQAHYLAYASSGSDPEELLEIGRYMMKKARYKDALACFERADAILPSDDKRAFHAVNAAKDMLGWPTDSAMVIVPGDSIGNMRLRLTREQALEAWGEPIYKVDEDNYSAWGYGDGTSKHPVAVVFFDAEKVIEIITESKNHATSDGLNVSNFRAEKHRGRFVRMRDGNSDSDVFRYTLRGGGLAFYTGSPSAPESVRAVVYDGEAPLTEHIGARWVYFIEKDED